MLKQLFNFNYLDHFYVACSGGVDSMAVCHFYLQGKKNFSIAHFNHGTPNANKYQALVEKFARDNNIPIVIGKLNEEKPKGKSIEHFWRDHRYAFLQSLNSKVVTCHHLNDAVEGFLFNTLNGNPKIISSKRDYIYRPFLVSTKQDMIDWCVSHKVEWVEDLTNQDVHFPRNRIRHNIMPEALLINPGLEKVIKKKILAEYEPSRIK